MNLDTLNAIYKQTEEFQNKLIDSTKELEENLEKIDANFLETINSIEFNSLSEEHQTQINTLKSRLSILNIIKDQNGFFAKLNTLQETHKKLNDSLGSLNHSLESLKVEKDTIEKEKKEYMQKFQELSSNIIEFKNMIDARKESEINEIEIRNKKNIILLLEFMVSIENEFKIMQNAEDIAALSVILHKTICLLEASNIKKINTKPGDTLNLAIHKVLQNKKNPEKKNQILEVISDGFIDSEKQQTLICSKVIVATA